MDDSRDKLIAYLDRHDLRHTRIRFDTLSYFAQSGHALSPQMLETKFTGVYDRTTIYRTLKTFTDKGIIHKIAGDGQAALYGLCHDHHDIGHEHSDSHVHFKCNDCGNTYCLDDSYIPPIKLPGNFTAAEFQFLVIGTCNHCHSSIV